MGGYPKNAKWHDCPLSALLFLFVAEILATKLETNENIFGFRINDYEIRNI